MYNSKSKTWSFKLKFVIYSLFYIAKIGIWLDDFRNYTVVHPDGAVWAAEGGGRGGGAAVGQLALRGRQRRRAAPPQLGRGRSVRGIQTHALLDKLPRYMPTGSQMIQAIVRNETSICMVHKCLSWF